MCGLKRFRLPPTPITLSPLGFALLGAAGQYMASAWGKTEENWTAAPYINTWEQFYELWYSGDATTATITILNQNTGGDGNDFGLDDISFCELVLVGAPECTVTVGTMTASAYAEPADICDGGSTTLFAQASGGTNNFTYNWTPANLLDDPTSQHPVANPPLGSTVFTCHVSDGNTAQDVSVTVDVHPNVEKHLEVSICENDVYDFFGEQLSESGEYVHHLETQWGCDSLIRLTLSVDAYQMPPVVYQYECYLHGTTPSWYWDKTGITYHENTTDEILLDDPNGGCPILHRLDLKFHEEYYEETTKVACGEFYWPVTGLTYNQSQDGITQTFHHPFGDKQCDSTFVLNLTIANYETTYIEVPQEESCNSFFWDPQGKSYSTDDPLDPENHIFTQSGEYHRTYSNLQGCDSIVTLTVDFEYTPAPTPIYPMDANNAAPHWVVTASEFQINSYDFHLWDTNPHCSWDSVAWSIDGPSDWVLEPFGDNNQCCKVYVVDQVDDTVWLKARAFNRCAPALGIEQNYWLLCSFYGLDEPSWSKADFSVVPNPNNGAMTLGFDNLTGKIEVKVYDMTGVLIDYIQGSNELKTSSIHYDLKNCANGLYFFVATGKEGTVTKKVIVN